MQERLNGSRDSALIQCGKNGKGEFLINQLALFIRRLLSLLRQQSPVLIILLFINMFLVFGESLIDMVEQPDGSFVPVAGGAPYNFARALALQGVPSAYLNPFSSDAFGRLLRDTLAASDALHFGQTTSKPTSLAFVATDTDGKPQYSFYRSAVADRDLSAAEIQTHTLRHEATALHSGGLALVPPDADTALGALQQARARGLLCSIDLNMRPAVAQSLGVGLDLYREAALAAALAADIIKVSDEDLRYLSTTKAPLAAARDLIRHSARLVVLTLGAEGAWALSDSLEVFQPALPVKVLDSVGAGDCFFAGFIAALQRADALRPGTRHQHDQLKRALQHASACAAINLTRRGCAPPSWDEAQRRIQNGSPQA